ncbi:hypothetical protein COLSTE_01406 [Collinsella stercoris DSM 13279]|uniref:Uncharacterized protein n=1 Tax=Collinsella stercoris DSM 13279 TaxID=445975 RepID=B6GBE7_9ACTN|nr:hypothetical protein COLSTE_01406 [Collinsella stercoris DSM 13279]
MFDGQVRGIGRAEMRQTEELTGQVWAGKRIDWAGMVRQTNWTDKLGPAGAIEPL